MSDSDHARIDVELPSGVRYPIVFGPLDGLPSGMARHGLRQGRCVILSDENVAALYGDAVSGAFSREGWDVRLVVLPAGESTKSLEHFGMVLDAVLPWGIDRRTPLVALGGGVVGDLGGFVAASLLRGLPLVHAPTTLLAQVDSAIGGKTGINHPAGKNLVGAFHQPRLVWSDAAVLATLPRREWTGGVAEVVKHALIEGDPLLERLEARLDRFLAADPIVVPALIREAAAVKARIVEIDERESGIRAFLNFGHTFAHALERALGYGTLSHGEAVAVGMRAALHLSRSRRPTVAFERAIAMVDSIPVPAIPGSLGLDELTSAMRYDKKADARRLRFVLLDELGSPCLVDDIGPEEVEAAWRFALRRGA
jgi:3-dehydroquinate synthase